MFHFKHDGSVVRGRPPTFTSVAFLFLSTTASSPSGITHLKALPNVVKLIKQLPRSLYGPKTFSFWGKYTAIAMESLKCVIKKEVAIRHSHQLTGARAFYLFLPLWFFCEKHLSLVQCLLRWSRLGEGFRMRSALSIRKTLPSRL